MLARFLNARLPVLPGAMLAWSGFLAGRAAAREAAAQSRAAAFIGGPARGFALASPAKDSDLIRGRQQPVGLWFVALLFVAGFAVVLAWLAMKRDGERVALGAALARGDPDLGAKYLLQYGCAGCHAVKGVRGPGGLVGPPLDDVARRVYLGGMLPNTPDNLVHWIRDPKSVNPRTAMPVTGISEREARDVAAFLLSR